ncbi:MAG: DegT/DnrJ/EryC1/StrS family aminotransferase [Prolixibacteraceae bacterium]|jgi:UDP-2-acetamido-2-deoxy-ribo-hexuluronate aminotransferase|nr:DegT/DnrJ/EryC1/StrS family aminotransferase [Prolixibacteraceae bacterium]
MQFCDLNRQYQKYQTEIDQAINGVIASSSFINGQAILDLEKSLSGFVGVKHAITCSSGTDALLLPLMAYGIEPNDEIICPAFSFIASASMISFLKAKPVFVDVSPIDFNIQISKIEEKITSKTRGIIAVSLFGQCPDLDAINAIAKKYNLWVIEDAAQSFGATLNGKPSCSHTDVATTSFFPAKPLGCYGDGGAVFTNDSELAVRMMRLRSHGQEKRYVHSHIGLNARMDTIQAAILGVKLKHFNQEIENRQKAAALYSSILDDSVLLPEAVEGRTSVWAQYTIGVANRNELKEKLLEKGIPTAVHYPLILPKQEAFKSQIVPNEKFEVAQLFSETVLSLPMHGLISENEVEFVANTIIELGND